MDGARTGWAGCYCLSRFKKKTSKPGRNWKRQTPELNIEGQKVTTLSVHSVGGIAVLEANLLASPYCSDQYQRNSKNVTSRCSWLLDERTRQPPWNKAWRKWEPLRFTSLSHHFHIISIQSHHFSGANKQTTLQINQQQNSPSSKTILGKKQFVHSPSDPGRLLHLFLPQEVTDGLCQVLSWRPWAFQEPSGKCITEASQEKTAHCWAILRLPLR